MNDAGAEPRMAMKGEMSDVNVWDRTLKDEEVEAFHQCESLEGNVVSWRETALNIVNLDQSQVEKSQVCYKPADRYRSFLNQENYGDTQTFCYKIGGEMAEARDRETLAEMVSAFTALQVDTDPAEDFYIGYNDQEGEGTWEGVVSGHSLAWDNWVAGYPRDATTANECATTSSLYDWKFWDARCSSKLRPICEFTSEDQRFKLFGLPEEYQMGLDVYYFLNNSTNLEGYLRWKLKIFLKVR